MALIRINDFISSINKKGVLKDNKYVVSFRLPNYLQTNAISIFNGINSSFLLSLRCENASIPGLQFASVDGPPRFGYGPIEYNPYNVVYEDITLTFLLDSDSEIHKIFYDWMNSIVNFHAQGQALIGSANAAKGPVSGMAPYEVGYKDDYITDLKVEVYPDANYDKASMELIAYRAFPKSVTPLNLNWSDGQPLKLQVVMTYTDFEINYPNKA